MPSRTHALRDASRPRPLHPQLLNPLLKIFINPNRVVHVLHMQERINNINAQQFCVARRAVREDGRPLLRGDSQPRARGDAPGHRGQEHEDAAGVAEQPDRFRRAPRARARRRGAVQARHRSGARAAAAASAARAGALDQQQPRPAPPPSPPEPVAGRQAASTAPQPERPADPASESNTARRRRRRRRGPPRRARRSRARAWRQTARRGDGATRRVATPPHGDPTAEAALDEGAGHRLRRRSDWPGPARTTRRRAGTVRAVKLAIVVQRYGADINGGAELHARYVAEHLVAARARHVLTTCARDYVTWHDEYPAGRRDVNGVPVHRFPVDHERDVKVSRRSDHVFEHPHSYLDELEWLDAEGPTSTRLMNHICGPQGRLRLLPFFQLSVLSRLSRRAGGPARRSSCRPRSATTRSAFACRRRSFAASAR